MNYSQAPFRTASGRVLLFAAACVALSGCGSDRPDPAAGGGRALRTSIARIRGFDPAKAGDVASAVAIGRVYEGLLTYSYTNRPYRLEPLLADGMPEVSRDGLTYTFRIRPGVRFHDDPCFCATGGRGRELTARDFVYSIKRVADQKTASSGFWAFNDRIVGLNEFRAKSGGAGPTDYSADVEGLQAPDPHTLRIRLERPYPQLLWVLAMQYAFAVPREAVEAYGDDFVNHPVGTGPYVLAGWRRNYRMEFRRNPAWFGAPPAIDTIISFVMDDPTTRWLAFLSGQIDLYSDISRDNWDAVVSPDGSLSRDLAGKGITLQSIPSLNTYYIGFNMSDPVLGPNRKLRQALNCAFDSAQWVDFYNGRVVPASGPLPPGVAGYDGLPSLYAFDLERAAKLLEEAGYPGGRDPATGRRLQLTLELGRTDTETRESTELLVGFMDRLGVVVTPSYNNQPAFFSKIEKRQAQMFRLSWFADYPDAENFLQLFYSANASPGPNRSNYSNPEFDALYEKARVLQDSPARTDLYRRMAALVVEDAPWLFLHHPVDFTLAQARVENYRPHDFPYGMERHYRIRD